MHRDWLAITQPETAEEWRFLHHYKPNSGNFEIYENGGDQVTFFPPAAQPLSAYEWGSIRKHGLIDKI